MLDKRVRSGNAENLVLWERCSKTLTRGPLHLASSMSDYSGHFCMTLCSNASQDLYPDNKIAGFTVELPQPIILGPNTNCQVGLCEFSCPGAIGKSIGLIYCEVISPQFVGSSLVRCLRTASLECRHEFENVYYLPVVKQQITNKRLEILTSGASESPSRAATRPRY